MYFRLGDYRFPSGSVEFSTGGQRQYSPRGNSVLIRRKMDLIYVMQANTPAILTRQILRLMSALDKGGDFGLYEDNGNPTAYIWRDSDTFGGIRVVSDASPVGDGTEYVTSRTISISIEADFPDLGSPLLSFSETVTITGDGGPEEIYLPVLKGKWQRQQVSERSLVTATQSGEITFWGKKPTIADCPRPLWPQFELKSRRSFTSISAQNFGGDVGECKASYSYSYQSNEPLVGSATDL